ncbi:hypothetical protein BASA81_013527 [Batrachochytrium salamandrivorans]|nr:hypothetical protein BASA81_013527 [Batrachochytrium salamandrivorans]
MSTVGSALGNSHITIVGKTAGKQVLKTHRNVRTIPTNDNYMKISTTGFTFTGTSTCWTLPIPSYRAWEWLEQLERTMDDWQRFSDMLAMSTLPDAFFTAPVGTEINIGLNVDLDTELGCDFLYLSVREAVAVLKTSSFVPRGL